MSSAKQSSDHVRLICRPCMSQNAFIEQKKRMMKKQSILGAVKDMRSDRDEK